MSFNCATLMWETGALASSALHWSSQSTMASSTPSSIAPILPFCKPYKTTRAVEEEEEVAAAPPAVSSTPVGYCSTVERQVGEESRIAWYYSLPLSATTLILESLQARMTIASPPCAS